MTTVEMLDSLNAVYTQIRIDQKKVEYDDILVMVEEIAYFLRSEYKTPKQPPVSSLRTPRPVYPR